MRLAGLTGVHRRRHARRPAGTANTVSPPDLVQRDFSASGPDELWVADITYLPTDAGFLYLAVLIDAWSRLVVELVDGRSSAD